MLRIVPGRVYLVASRVANCLRAPKATLVRCGSNGWPMSWMRYRGRRVNITEVVARLIAPVQKHQLFSPPYPARRKQKRAARLTCDVEVVGVVYAVAQLYG